MDTRVLAVSARNVDPEAAATELSRKINERIASFNYEVVQDVKYIHSLFSEEDYQTVTVITAFIRITK